MRFCSRLNTPLLALTLILPVIIGIAVRADGRPNIIFILADDLGYGDVGFNGQRHIRTPNLDRMARDGMVFTQHYAGSTVCMPSRCALLTGKHMGHATIRSNPRWTTSGTPVDLGDGDITVAEELKRAGYRTAVIGKWGLAESDDMAMPLRQGFDSFFGYRRHGAAHHYYPTKLWRDHQSFEIPQNDPQTKQGTYSHDMLVDEALRFVGQHGSDPFFLYLALTIPHSEITVPKDSKVPYLNLGWPARKMSTGGHYKHDPEGNTAYAGMVSRMDRDIGRLRDLLEERGIAENTLILFSSDNGPEFEKRDGLFNSNGPLRGGKRELYEGGIRVPFVAVWPGSIEGGSESGHISAFWDFLPTACEAAGIDPSDRSIDGISYLPTLLGNSLDQVAHESLYWEFNEKAGPIQAVRFGDWKAVRRLGGSCTIELYNLKDDLGEQVDVAEQNPRAVARAERFMASERTEDPEFVLTARRKVKKQQ